MLLLYSRWGVSSRKSSATAKEAEVKEAGGQTNRTRRRTGGTLGSGLYGGQGGQENRPLVTLVTLPAPTNKQTRGIHHNQMHMQDKTIPYLPNNKNQIQL